MNKQKSKDDKLISLYNIFRDIKLQSKTSFIESIDVAVNLGIDTRKHEQNVKGTVTLPYGTGNRVKIAVFADGQTAEKAKKAGADFVGMYDLSNKIKQKKIKVDIIIASPETMNIISELGPIIGPKGLMPSAQFGTMVENVELAIKNIRSGQIKFKNDRNGIVHSIIGKTNFTEKQLSNNFISFICGICRVKPKKLKGKYIKKISISSTMGKSLNVNIENINSIL